ncbi:MAG: PIN-like domain-containing protein [Tomitella sp.]|nr:PIN-like domain-containing protein [Tomitella sp.]
MSGLFSGYEGHRIPSDAEVNECLSSALVAVDANVLLGLYRYPDEFSSALRGALEEMNDRLFVPRQALVEFWRNRTSALADRARAKVEIERRLSGCEKSVVDAINTWAKVTAIDEVDREHAVGLVGRQFETLRNIVSDSHQDDVETYPSPGLDPIVQALDSLLEGRVGLPLSAEEFEAAVEEGKRRHANEEPPGYREKLADKEHLAENVSGDYLVWAQSIAEAGRRGLDLLIITNDEKDDWYWRSQGSVIGPRSELSKEFWRFTGRRLFLLTSLEFMRRYARQGGNVSEGAIVEAERQSVAVPEKEEPGVDGRAGWSALLVDRLLEVLDIEAPVQAAVIRAAAENGGSVGRDEVYRIGNYGAKRMLRGFTRPVRRVSRMLQEAGELDLTAPDMLQPRYDFGVQANAFEIPPEVVDILTEGRGR